MTLYTRGDSNVPTVRQVAITAVDAINHGASGVINAGGIVWIDTSYYVGAVQVTPTVGEQWVISKLNGQWRLDHRIPFNDPNDAGVVPTQGTHVIGSGQGPAELCGTVVRVNAPMATLAVPTANRPAADSVAAGTQIYDATLGLPIWSNGTAWHDSVGDLV